MSVSTPRVGIEFPYGSPLLDAFGRLQVSNAVTLFDSTFQYDKAPVLWQETLAGSGTSTHVANESAINLAVTTASGDKVTRQTKQYFRYQPGKGQMWEATAVLNTPKANLRQRIGYFDASDGIYFETAGTTINICRRTYTSGAAVNETVAQADWSENKFLSTSGKNYIIDMAGKSLIFVIDLQWLGAGLVRTGFNIDGQIHWAHFFRHSNILTLPYMRTACLPCRVEIENTGVAASGSTLKQICTVVMSQGGHEDERGYHFTANNGVTEITPSARRPVLSIRPRTTFNSVTNRATILPEHYEVFATQSTLVELVYNPATMTGASFADVDTTYSVVQYDVAATAITGGTVVDSFYVPAGGVNNKAMSTREFPGKLPFTLDEAGSVADVYTIMCTPTTGSNPDVLADICWKELR